MLVTEIQQRRVCGAGRTRASTRSLKTRIPTAFRPHPYKHSFDTQDSCDEHMNEEIKQVAAGIPILNSP
ncbi:hypothetical protein CN168_18945 [Sinorhizobium medicae]|nr:hypothetical protein CN168_18945 [Sinorhizobium medicae]